MGQPPSSGNVAHGLLASTPSSNKELGGEDFHILDSKSVMMRKDPVTASSGWPERGSQTGISFESLTVKTTILLFILLLVATTTKLVHPAPHPALTVQPMQSGESTSEQADRLLVYYIGTCDQKPFYQFCNEHMEHFGGMGSKERRNWQHRKRYLCTKPSRVKELFDSYFPRQKLFFTYYESSPATPSPARSIRSSTQLSSPPFRSSTQLSSPQIMPVRTQENTNNHFQLSLEHPENNPEGVLLVKQDSVVSKNTMVSKLTVFIGMADMNDCGSNKVTCRLSDNGDTIIVSRPSHPTFMSTNLAYFNGVTAIGESDTEKEAIGNKLSVIETKYGKLKDQGGFRREVHYKLPIGMTCNSEHFNEAKTDPLDVVFELCPMAYTMESAVASSEPVLIYFPILKINLAIDGNDESMKPASTKSKVTSSMARLANNLKNMEIGEVGLSKPTSKHPSDAPNQSPGPSLLQSLGARVQKMYRSQEREESIHTENASVPPTSSNPKNHASMWSKHPTDPPIVLPPVPALSTSCMYSSSVPPARTTILTDGPKAQSTHGVPPSMSIKHPPNPCKGYASVPPASSISKNHPEAKSPPGVPASMSTKHRSNEPTLLLQMPPLPPSPPPSSPKPDTVLVAETSVASLQTAVVLSEERGNAKSSQAPTKPRSVKGRDKTPVANRTRSKTKMNRVGRVPPRKPKPKELQMVQPHSQQPNSEEQPKHGGIDDEQLDADMHQMITEEQLKDGGPDDQQLEADMLETIKEDQPKDSGIDLDQLEVDMHQTVAEGQELLDSVATNTSLVVYNQTSSGVETGERLDEDTISLNPRSNKAQKGLVHSQIQDFRLSLDADVELYNKMMASKKKEDWEEDSV